MLLEIRTYRLRPGVRDEFAAWFEEEVRPAMEAHGMRILGSFVSVDDPDRFVYLRWFVDEAERRDQTRAFYESPLWVEEMRPRALGMELDYQVLTVRPALPGSGFSRAEAEG